MPEALSILVPVRDEQGSLRQLAAEVQTVLDDRVLSQLGLSRWELVLIDDGSTDASWEVMEELAEADPRIRGIRLRRNCGKSAALAAGLREATGSIVATMDGDLQDDPAELPGMIERLAGPVDLIAGHKMDRKDPLSKRLPSKVFNRATSLVTGLRLHDHNCGLKVARREVFEHVPLYGEMHRFFAALGHAQGFRVAEQVVNHRPRIHGRSKFGLERYARGGLDLLTVVTLTRFSRRPAHLFGGLGLLFGLSGSVILLYLSGVWALSDQPIGSRPLLLFGVLLLILSVQLASIGLIAELLISQQVAREDPRRFVTMRTDPVGTERGGNVVPSDDPAPLQEP